MFNIVEHSNKHTRFHGFYEFGDDCGLAAEPDRQMSRVQFQLFDPFAHSECPLTPTRHQIKGGCDRSSKWAENREKGQSFKVLLIAL